MAAVCSGQHTRRGGRSDCQGYGGVACMQPSTVSRHEYPDCCEQEQSHLRWFAKFGLAREETGDDGSGSDSLFAICHLDVNVMTNEFIYLVLLKVYYVKDDCFVMLLC